MSRYYLGLDSSTQSLTAIVIDVETGRVVEQSVSFDEIGAKYGAQHGVTRRPEQAPRAGERVWSDPRMWLEALDTLFDRLRARQGELGFSLAEVGAISGSGQQHGTVYLNDQAPARLAALADAPSLTAGLEGAFARLRSPIWMDSSTGLEVAELEQGVGGRDTLRRLTGNVAFERFSAAQIRRIHKASQPGSGDLEDQDAYQRTAHIALVSSFMPSVLAGQIAPIDPGDGAGMNLMDIERRTWCPAALDATAPGLADRLPPIAPSDGVVGQLSPYFTRYGLSADCVVTMWSGDNPCSLIGLGLVAPGQAAISLGTSHTMFAPLAEARTCETGEGCLFASPTGAQMALLCFANGGLAWERVRDQFGLSWPGFSALLAATEAGNRDAAGAFRLMFPGYVPEIAPKVPHSLVVYQGLLPNDSRGCVRGAVEARALSTRVHSEWMGERVRSLRLTGGGAKNLAVAQIFANVFGAPVELLRTSSSAALGAALMARHAHLKSSGRPLDWQAVVAPFTSPDRTVAPDPRAVAVYNEMVDAYRHFERRHTATA